MQTAPFLHTMCPNVLYRDISSTSSNRCVALYYIHGLLNLGKVSFRCGPVGAFYVYVEALRSTALWYLQRFKAVYVLRKMIQQVKLKLIQPHMSNHLETYSLNY